MGNKKPSIFQQEVTHLWGCGMGHGYIMNALKLTEEQYRKGLFYMNKNLPSHKRIYFDEYETTH